MPGYSGTPLAQKLGIKPGWTVLVENAPPHYGQLLDPMPAGVKFVAKLSTAVDLVHFFVRSRSALAKSLRQMLRKMRPDAVIWVSWPKKASQIETDITDHVIRDVALPMGLVDIKVCAVDETWSGLKLVLRVELRPKISQ
jgi:hypothetical protein